MAGEAGIALLDKPGGMTSHAVVAVARRRLGTRRVGHAGTLDPMATGLLLIGVDAATRLLTYLVGLDKTYRATIRLGAATDTDDADGEILARADPAALADATEDARMTPALAALRGTVSQVPSAVSAIKVDGRRAYARVRAGEQVSLAARTVTVSRLDVEDVRRGGDHVDVDVVVDCSSGTYIRAIARDLGDALGVGGHLVRLRRTRIGPFDVAAAVAPDDVGRDRLLSPADVAARVLPVIEVAADEATALRQGRRLVGQAGRLPGELAAALAPDGGLVGVVGRRADDVRSVMILPTSGPGGAG